MRTLLTVLVLLVATPPLSVMVIFGAVVGASDRFYDRIARFWCRSVIRASGVRLRAEGLENVPRDRPIIILSNHASWFDVAALAVLVPQRYRFVAKQELRSIPLWGRAWQAAGHIAVDRKNTQRAIESLTVAGALIRTDNSAIIIFPEGTRAAGNELLPFKKGGFRLAASLGVDIVPVGIQGSRDVLPRNSWRVRSRPIIVRFGVPVPTTGIDADRLDELMIRVRSEIDALRRAPEEPGTEDHAGDHQHSRA